MHQFRPGPLSRADVAALMEIQQLLESNANVNVAPPFFRAGDSISSDTNPDSFWAKITGSGTDAHSVTVYAWTEQFVDSQGNWVDLDGGRSGTTTLNPAYEVNHAPGVVAGTIVEMRQGFYNCGNGLTTELEFLFSAPPLSSGGPLTIYNSGSPPPAPPTGYVTIYQIGGSVFYILPSGVSYGFGNCECNSASDLSTDNYVTCVSLSSSNCGMLGLITITGLTEEISFRVSFYYRHDPLGSGPVIVLVNIAGDAGQSFDIAQEAAAGLGPSPYGPIIAITVEAKRGPAAMDYGFWRVEWTVFRC